MGNLARWEHFWMTIGPRSGSINPQISLSTNFRTSWNQPQPAGNQRYFRGCWILGNSTEISEFIHSDVLSFIGRLQGLLSFHLSERYPTPYTLLPYLIWFLIMCNRLYFFSFWTGDHRRICNSTGSPSLFFVCTILTCGRIMFGLLPALHHALTYWKFLNDEHKRTCIRSFMKRFGEEQTLCHPRNG